MYSKLKILVVGGGGREHALIWKIVQSPLVESVYCAPGSAIISTMARSVPLEVNDLQGICAFASQEGIDLVVIGPEAPLVGGLTNLLRESGIRVFGPSKEAALLEGSKAFMKGLLTKYGIPTAAYKLFTSPDTAKKYLHGQSFPVVVKASGLAAGKGVFICETRAEAEEAIDRIMVHREFPNAGSTIVIEDFLKGEELSFHALVDGNTILPLASAQDHKALLEGDRGPNTGGMGSYSPAPFLTEDLERKIMDQIMVPTVRAMELEGRPYKGVLYAGLMIDGEDVSVLEFNVRFGDPETQPLLMRMQSDIVPLLLSTAEGTLSGMQVEWSSQTALCVVMTSGGYPGEFTRGYPITGLEAAMGAKDVYVFHAGTDIQGGSVVTAGGRVLGITALGDTVSQAQNKANAVAAKIQWERAYYREDIGYRAIEREG